MRKQVRTCSANPVHIVLMVIGHFIVDHQHQVLHIQPSGSNGSGDKHIADARLEVVDGALSVRLVLGSMQRQARVANLQK
jgi:hypothetical protein